jgi:hypothetical protein
MTFPLPAGVVANIGRFLDFDTRRNCILAHRGLCNAMEGYTSGTWAVQPWSDFGAKARALLKYQPRLDYIVLEVDAASPTLTEVQTADLGAFFKATMTSVDAIEAAGGDLLPVFRCALSFGVPEVACEVPSFSRALVLLEELAARAPLIGIKVEITVRGCAILANNADAALAERLLKENKWLLVDNMHFVPKTAAEFSTMHIRERQQSPAACATIRSLIVATCRKLSVRIGLYPTLLSDLAYRVDLYGYLKGCRETEQILQHLADNARLAVVAFYSLDPQKVARLPQLAAALHPGVKVLLFVNNSTQQLVLGGFVSVILGTTQVTTIELVVDRSSIAKMVAARRALELVNRVHPREIDRVECSFFGQEIVPGLQAMSLQQLEAELTRSAPPWQRLMFGIAGKSVG